MESNNTNELVGEANNSYSVGLDTSSSPANGEKTKEKKLNKKLFFIFVGLGAIAIILIVAIVVINLDKSSVGDEEEEEIVLTAPECIELENSVAIGQCIQKIYDRDMDVDALINNYAMAIKKSTEKEDYSTVAEMISDRSLFLVSIGQCDNAIKALDSIGSCSFDNESLYFIYNDAVGIGIACEDQNIINKYNGLIKQLTFEEEQSHEE